MTSRPLTIRSERRCRFPTSTEQVWTLLSRVEDYPATWPCLRRWDATGLVAGEEWRYRLRAAVPYPLRGAVRIERVVPAALIVAAVSGDLSGRCRLELAGRPDGTDIRLTSELTAVRGPIRLVSQLLPGLARWTHDRMLDTATRQLHTALVSPAPAAASHRSGQGGRGAPTTPGDVAGDALDTTKS